MGRSWIRLNMADKRESGRIKEVQSRRILDEATRRRRQRKALEALEADNFQDDPHADLTPSKKAPKFEDLETTTPTSKKKKKGKLEFRLRIRKTLQILLEEELSGSKGPNYLTCAIPPSKLPERKFCAVCGFASNYTCVTCGARYCCVRCLGTHQDTRCLKMVS